MRKNSSSEVARLEAVVRKKDLQVKSLEKTLETKVMLFRGLAHHVCKQKSTVVISHTHTTLAQIVKGQGATKGTIILTGHYICAFCKEFRLFAINILIGRKC